MTAARYCSHVDTLEQKLQIQRRLGSLKACNYFDLLTRFLSVKISKREFDRLCIATIGRDNIPLHNSFLKSILIKASLPNTTLPRQSKEGCLNVKSPNGCNNLKYLSNDFPRGIRKSRTPHVRDRRFRDRPSPLGPHGKTNNNGFEDASPKIQEQQSNVDLHSEGTRLLVSVEDGAEDYQDSENLVIDRSLIQAPLGIPTYNNKGERVLHKGLSSGTVVTDTCKSSGQLPDRHSLMKMMKPKMEMEGLEVSEDASNLLNKALDVYLKRLIKPCLDLAASKPVAVKKLNGPIRPGMSVLRNRYIQKLTRPVSASMSEFRTTIELNRTVLGEDWPLKYEKICLRVSEE